MTKIKTPGFVTDSPVYQTLRIDLTNLPSRLDGEILYLDIPTMPIPEEMFESLREISNSDAEFLRFEAACFDAIRKEVAISVLADLIR